MVLLIGIHIVLIRLHGVTEFRFKNEGDQQKYFSFFPDHLYTELIMGLILMIILSALATILPASLGPRADPLTTPEVIKPEWFFYMMFRWLKLFSGTAAVLSIGFIIFVMFIWPFIDAVFRRFPRMQEASVWIGIVAVLLIVGLTVWEAAVEH